VARWAAGADLANQGLAAGRIAVGESVTKCWYPSERAEELL
jgi:hypothetical protein